MKEATHSLLSAIVASAMLLPVLASRHEPFRERAVIQVLAADASSTSSPVPTTAVISTTTQTTTSAATTTPTSATTSPTVTTPTTSSSSAAVTTTTHATSEATSTTPVVISSVVPTTATDSQGQVYTSLVTESATLSSAAPSQTSTSNSSSDSGLSTGSVVGLSVAGGIAALGIILFFVWKFTRKRFTDFDDNEAIKWPELNAHDNDVHALPTKSTGRAGFGPENESDADLTRAPSPGAYANSIAASSVPETYGGAGDPYAVPPLPHLNPNQPYRDEPGAYAQPTGYYDPYRGPVPNTFADSGQGPESIPMTQMARIRSPGPQVAYDMQGRGSPAPQAATGYAGMDERSRTPVLGALGAGRASPSPHPGYGYGP